MCRYCEVLDSVRLDRGKDKTGDRIAFFSQHPAA